MLLVDPADTKRIEVQGRAYHLRHPKAVERAKFRHAVRAQGGRLHAMNAIINEIEAAILDILPEGDPDREKPEAAIASWRESEETDSENAQYLEALRQEFIPIWPRLAEMDADHVAYFEIAGIEGTRLFLMDWEGFEGKIHRRMGLVDEPTLQLIPQNHFEVIGVELSTMMQVSAQEKKGSPSSSTGDSAQTHSVTSKKPRRKNR